MTKIQFFFDSCEKRMTKSESKKGNVFFYFSFFNLDEIACETVCIFR